MVRALATHEVHYLGTLKIALDGLRFHDEKFLPWESSSSPCCATRPPAPDAPNARSRAAGVRNMATTSSWAVSSARCPSCHTCSTSSNLLK